MANVSIRSYVRRGRKGGAVKVRGYVRKAGRKGIKTLSDKKRKKSTSKAAPGDEFKAKMEDFTAKTAQKEKPAYEGPQMTDEQVAAWDKAAREAMRSRYPGYKKEKGKVKVIRKSLKKEKKDIFSRIENSIAKFVERQGKTYKRQL